MRCPKCNGVIVVDPATYERVCLNCGYVAESILEERVMPTSNVIKGVLFYREFTSEDSACTRAKEKLARVSEVLRINEEIQREILNEYRLAMKHVKRDKTSLLAVVVYFRLREYDPSMTLVKVVNAFRSINSRVTVSRALNVIHEMHKANYRTENWESIIEDFAGKLSKMYGVSETKMKLLLKKYVELLRIRLLGRSRRNVVAAIAYILLRRTMRIADIEKFAKAIGVPASSLRKNLEYVEQILPVTPRPRAGYRALAASLAASAIFPPPARGGSES